MRKWDYVSDWFIGNLHEKIEEEFYDFQNKHDIENEDLPPELNDKLAEAVENMLNIMDACMLYQKSNNATYATKLDD